MRRVGAVALALCAGIGVTGCGGADAPSGSRALVTRPVVAQPPPPPPPPIAAHPRTGSRTLADVRRRVLAAGELAGFVPAGVNAYGTLSGWVAGESGSSEEQTMLARAGFHAGAVEQLDNHGTQGLSLVEELGSPAGARTALRFYLSQATAPGSQEGTYAPFRVAGIPGAAGYWLRGPNASGINIAFTAGRFYYLVGRETQSSVAVAQLSAAARHLYARVS